MSIRNLLSRVSSFLFIFSTALNNADTAYATGIEGDSVAHEVVDIRGGGDLPQDSVANRLILDQVSGIDVVNIVRPNGSEISHNKFTDFNVPTEGVVINNSTASGTSDLAGSMYANPNFNGTAATTIINQVTSSNTTSLLGLTEVFGGSATYIVANPYGITCDGCGFMNTPSVVLTTGTPEFDSGDLVGFDVEGGQVTIEGDGLNSTNMVDYFDIISRTAVINANITSAQGINVTTGRIVYDYENKVVAEVKADNLDPKPNFAIDAGVLGSMFSGAISLVATETGVGVNLEGGLIADLSNVVIQADGKITYAAIEAENDINITSAADSIEQTGNITAQNDINLMAYDNISIAEDSFAAAVNDINFDSASISHNGSLVADNDIVLNTSGLFETSESSSIQATNDLTVSSDSIDSYGNIMAYNVTLDSLATLALNGGTQAAGNVNLTSVGKLTSNGTIEAGGDVNLTSTTDEIAQDAGNILADGNINLTAHDNVTVAEGSFIVSVLDTKLKSTDASIADSGTIIAANIILEAAQDINHGDLDSSNDITITADSGSITQSGQADADNDVAITATSGSINVTGNITAGHNVGLQADANIDIDAASFVLAGNDISFGAASISHNGYLFSDNDIALNASGNLEVSEFATVQATNDLTISSGSNDLSGQLEANNLTLDTSGALTLNTDLQIGNNVSLTSVGKLSYGNISAGGNATLISTSDDIEQIGDYLVAGGDVTLNADQNISYGSIESGVDLNLTAGANITQNNGSLVSGNNVNINAVGKVSYSIIQSSNDINITSTADEISQDEGNILAAVGDINLTSYDDLTIAEDLYIVAGNDVKLESTNASVAQNGNIIANNITLLAAQDITYNNLASDNDITVTADSGSVTQSGAVTSGNDVTVTATSGSVNLNGNIDSVRDINLVSGSDIAQNSGSLTSARDTNMSAVGEVTYNNIQAGNDVNITSDTGSITQSGGQTSAVNNIVVTASLGSVNLNGNLFSGNDTTVISDGDISLGDNMEVISDRDITLHSVSGTVLNPFNSLISAARNYNN